jgi:hypothetical protein
VGRVRLLVRDADPSAARFTDDEIGHLLELEGSARTEAAACLEATAADLARKYQSERIGDYLRDQSRSAEALLAAARALRSREPVVAFDAVALRRRWPMRSC